MVGRPKATSTFIAQAHEFHGDKYDYSKVVYINSTTPVTITCPSHGEFQQTPDTHLRGGCARCGWEKPRRRRHRDTTAGFIERATAKHPTEGYDYSQVDYIDQTTPVTIGCPVHGPFQQKPYVHLSKSSRGGRYCGCPKCGVRRAGDGNQLTQDQIIAAFRQRHGDRYDYSKVKYSGARNPITIICREHGSFTQTAQNHSQGQGCRRCQIDGFRLSAADYVKRVTGVYNQAYEYPSLGRHVLAADRVRVHCAEHGAFDVNSRTHLYGRSGCPDCKQSGSRFERRIQRSLQQAGIPYVTQWTHPTLRRRSALRFDFMLPDTRTLIEFDGAFHFRPIQMPGQTWDDAVEAFEDLKQRDSLKTAWAAANGWQLIRLSTEYVEDELEELGILQASSANSQQNEGAST